MNYYNEFDPKAAQWLRNLVEARKIPQGYVDERSITEIEPDELRRYTQCHFFAGIAGWSLALQLAGWPADRPVWTGSCPCQPFSTAGRQKGQSDERHLWPVWFNLIRSCKPDVVFGEQVASAIGHGWLDGVYDDMEAEGYTVGAAVLPACSVNAPHRRERLWFVGYANGTRLQSWEQAAAPLGQGNTTFTTSCNVANAERIGQSGQGQLSQPLCSTQIGEGQADRPYDAGAGYWSNAEWIDCPDGKQRRIEPSIRLLADGFSVTLGGLQSIEDEAKKEIEKYVSKNKRNASETLSILWQQFYQKKGWEEQSIRMCGQFYEKKILLHFLFCLQSAFERAESSSSTKASKSIYDEFLPILWSQQKPACPSYRREPNEQQVRELTDTLPALSQFLACSAYSYWQKIRESHAALNRVTLLQGFGNAIVPQVAAQMIRAYMESTIGDDDE